MHNLTTAELNNLLADLLVRGQTVAQIVEDAEPRRRGRAPKVNVTTARTDDDETVYGECVGNSSGKTYQISIDPSTGKHHCNCPDHQQRSHRIGPCKHIIAVATCWLEGEARPTYRYYAEKKEMGA